MKSMQKNQLIQDIKEKNRVIVHKQEEYCKSINAPIFINEDGLCPYCHKDIFLSITEEDAMTKVVTGCPHCNRSFIDE